VSSHPARRGEKLSYPILIRPIQSTTYFQIREPYDILSMFKNPMAIMMLVTAVIVLVFPKMLNNMGNKTLFNA
jgi:hypothetical protein